MTLNFVLGKNQLDHQKKMMELFKSDYQKNSNGQFFFLVPNHIKFESEINTLKALGQDNGNDDELIATSNVQTFSLSRLAWYFLRDQSIYNTDSLTETKSAMLLRNIILQHKSELKIFSGMVGKPGFIDQLSTQFTELLNGQVEPDDLESVLSQDNPEVFTDKIQELDIIYQDYFNQIQGLATNTFQLDALSKFFDENLHTQNYYFYISGFSSFTAAELNLVKSMILNCHNVTILFALEQPVLKMDEVSDFYYRPANTYYQLYQIARAGQIAFHNFFADRLRVSEDIGKLEDYWIQSSEYSEKIQNTSLNDKSSVQVWKCTDKQTEVSSISTYIRQLVANQGYRYKDFLILTRDLGQYSSFIESFMENNEVPYFIDLQNKMTDHPFKKMIDLLFAWVNRGMQSGDVIALLRTELLIPEVFEKTDISVFREAVDLTENYVLVNGITRRSWLGKDFVPDAKLDSKVDAEKIRGYRLMNTVKDYVSSLYNELNNFFEETHTTVEATAFVYNLLTDRGVFKQLLDWQKLATEQHDLSQADRPQQVVNKFNEILDEYVNVFRDANFSSDDFIEILDAGFETATYSQVPSTLDAVSISEIGMIQPNDRQITIILGSTVNNMPGTSVSNNIISDDERQAISGALVDGKYLKDSDEIVNNSEPFLHDVVFTTAKERLIFTYPNFTDDNKQQELSSYVVRIMNHFELPEQNILLNPDSKDAEENQVIRYIGSKTSSLNYLIRVSRSALDNKIGLSSQWNYVRSSLTNDNLDQTKFVMSSLDYKNIPHDLSPDTVERLYGKDMNISISRLETFYENEYQYFLKYGLRLKPRQLFEITPAQTGSLFHAVLDGLVKYTNQEKVKIQDLTDEQLSKLVSDIFKEKVSYPENKVFLASARMEFIASQIEKTLRQLALAIKRQLSRNKFIPRASEVTFGRINNQENLPGLSFKILDKHWINVRGKIDRIDEMVVDGTDYLAVIDYKSSERDFDFSNFLEGLTMQMPTYLESLNQNLDILKTETDANDAKVAGAFYSRILNPKLKLTRSAITDTDLLKEFKLKGLVLDDEQLLKNIDTKLIGSGKSPIVPVKYKKDVGALGEPDSVLSQSDFFKVLNYNRHLITKAGEKIYSGKLNLNPYRDYQLKTGLTYSDYQSIFQFDAMLPENDYHEIIKYKKIDVLKRIEDILEDGEEDA
ncbi:PD-(D/E)XK nuclease family protein [Companilactobacillus jidongensis]|uniref:PD-(D/E)XK nuclease family protein n=1 Tax=Companilactobacillus jidongensis TaxID=2486006 RepID=UPI0013DE10EA|nr:PD-(D/E)XK nuclease family protein [Companilactobacillus jidongensis]